MKVQSLLFAKPVNLEALDTRFKTVAANVAYFFTDGCCLDTQPPLPPGN